MSTSMQEGLGYIDVPNGLPAAACPPAGTDATPESNHGLMPTGYFAPKNPRFTSRIGRSGVIASEAISPQIYSRLLRHPRASQ